VGEVELALTPIEFRLLLCLISHAGRVRTRQELMAEVWEAGDTDFRTVDAHVKRLREKLGAARDLLGTVRGIGYRLTASGASSRPANPSRLPQGAGSTDS